MNPFSNFGHFIAYFVPGLVFLFDLLILSGFIIGTDLIQDYAVPHLLLIIVLATILGLFLDEIRHTFLEEHLESAWAKKQNYNLDRMVDFVCYAPKIGIEVYKTIVDEYYYFYEFDANISVPLIFSGILVPIYLHIDHNISVAISIVLFCFLFAVGFVFFYCAKEAYEYFLSTVINTVSIIDPEFKESIKNEK